jgi:hypothetical protein
MTHIKEAAEELNKIIFFFLSDESQIDIYHCNYCVCTNGPIKIDQKAATVAKTKK